jgi:hypothetical protein
MDLSHLNAKNRCRLCFWHCPNVVRIRWQGSKGTFLNGNFRGDDSCHPTELHLDDSVFCGDGGGAAEVLRNYESNESPAYMLRFCYRLERVSIKNSSWTFFNREVHPVSQAMLIKMVRNHPALRWLRSDLTEENVAMLQKERPDITFVTE